MRKTPLKLLGLLGLALAVLFLVPQRAAAQDREDDDPPSRVARLSQVNGAVSFNPAGTDDWVDAVLNRPVTTGDKLWADNGSRAELNIGSASLRLSGNTGFSFLNLTDNTTQVQITEGTLRVRVKRLDENETFEIDTPNLAFSILRIGTYKITVNQSGDTTIVQVRGGQGEVTGGGSAYSLRANETGTFSGIDQISADVQGGGYDDDDFDRWCADRDHHEDHSVSSRYVSDEVIGYDDLDDNGGWRPVPEYGTVWFPHVTIVGWAPYRYGHWAFISPWGWTWVDDASWGFAPFHYGRWVTVGGVWGWVPCGPRAVVGVAYVRPVYAPALVAWVGGGRFSVGVAVGGGGPVGWFPLGPREVFVPSYHVSRTYVTRVNVSNTTVTNVTVNNYYNNVVVNKNVTNVTYVNRTSVTATSGQAFTSAQPVGRNMVRVDAREVASASVVATTPNVAPQQRSVLGSGGAARVRPPMVIQQRTVVAKAPPPPPPAPFVKQQQAIQANGGRPIAVSENRQLAVSAAAQQPQPHVRVAPPARLETMQNAPANRPNNPNQAPGQQAPPQNQQQVNPNRPSRGNPPAAQPTTPDNQQVNPNRPAQANPPAAQPTTPNNQQGNPNRQGNPPPAQASASDNRSNPRNYNDRPQGARPVPPPQANPQLDQKHDQQLEQLRQRQDQQRQKVEQQQVQQQQKIEQQRANEQKQQAVQQKQQQQLQELERKHDQEQQKLQQQQQQERARQASRPPPPPPKDKKADKPPKDEKPHNN